jgi:hypothetical protein
MLSKYKQQEAVNLELIKQIEMLEEMNDNEGIAEEMKKIYSGDADKKDKNSLS